MKQLIYLSLLFLVFSCITNVEKPTVPEETKDYLLIGGKTMGTTYSVKFDGENPDQINKELDVLFAEINQAVSTYEKSSLISKINISTDEWIDMDSNQKLNGHFVKNYLKSNDIFQKTNGLFDPTVMPIVNYWGFGYTGKKPIEEIDEKQVKSILEYVGMKKIDLVTETDTGVQRIRKLNPKVQLDFGAIAKGYAVDKAAELLSKKGIENYLVEIGGEVVTKGHNPNGKKWLIGINTPEEDARINDFKAYIEIAGKGMATSGNYRNFYEVNGEKYSHTINPKTGFPERSTLLSATIIANDCMTADAYATACMVGGLDQAMEWIKNDNSLEGYFIFSDKSGHLQTKYTSGFQAYLKN